MNLVGLHCESLILGGTGPRRDHKPCAIARSFSFLLAARSAAAEFAGGGGRPAGGPLASFFINSVLAEVKQGSVSSLWLGWGGGMSE